MSGMPALFLILALGFALRIVGIHFGLPHLYHADEPIVVNHALAYGAWDFNPHFFKIPPLVSYLLFTIYGGYYLLGYLTGSFRNVQDFEQLFYSDPSSFYLLARIVFGACLGTAAVYLLYRLIVKHFSRPHALLSAFFLAICFLHVRDSHYIYADIPLAAVILIAFCFLLRIAEDKASFKIHFWTGVMIGLAAATKYNGAALAFPYLYITCIESERKYILRNALTAFLGAVLAYLILNPFTLLDFPFFLKDIRAQAKAQGGTGWLHHLNYSLIGAVGLPMLIASGLGIVRLLRKFDAKKSALAFFLIAYYFILVFWGQPYDRYVLPMLPFMLFFASDFVLTIPQRLLQVTLIVLLSVFPLTASILFDKIMLVKDTRTLAKEWVESHIPAGAKLALDGDFYMPRLSFSRSQLAKKWNDVTQNPGAVSEAQKRKLKYLLSQESSKVPAYELYFLADEITKERFLYAQPLLPYRREALRERGIDYVLFAGIPAKGERLKLYEEIKRQAAPVVVFNPYQDSSQKFPIDRMAMTGGPFLWKDLVKRNRNGWTIEIYQLK